MLVTDVSRSMLADRRRPEPPGGRPQRRAALPGPACRTRRGWAPWPSPRSRTPSSRPTDDRATRSRRCIDALSADGGTATGDGAGGRARHGATAARRRRPPAAIVLLSDGKATTGRDPIEVARARPPAWTCPIYTVALGTPRRDRSRRPAAACSRCRPTPRRCAESPSCPGGRAFRGRGRRRAVRIYETPRLAGRHQGRASARSPRPSRAGDRCCCWRLRPWACGRRRDCPSLSAGFCANIVRARSWLRAEFERGKSLEQIGRETGRHASTVAYWARKHGLSSPGAGRYAARGARP